MYLTKNPVPPSQLTQTVNCCRETQLEKILRNNTRLILYINSAGSLSSHHSCTVVTKLNIPELYFFILEQNIFNMFLVLQVILVGFFFLPGSDFQSPKPILGDFSPKHFFKYLGKKDMGSTHLHLVVPLKLDHLIDHAYDLQQRIHDRSNEIKKYYKESSAPTLKINDNWLPILDSLDHRIQLKLVKLNETLRIISLPGEGENPFQAQMRYRRNTLDGNHTHQLQDRQRRQLGIAFGLLGLGNSIYNSFQVQSIQNHLDTMERETDVIVKEVELHHKVLDNMRQDIGGLYTATDNLLKDVSVITYNLAASKVVDRLGHAADIILEHISDTINGLHQLLYNHLHPTFISLEAIKVEFSQLEPKLRASNMRLFDLSPISVYHYPLSVYRLNNEVRYILHVPISTHLDRMTIFEYIPTAFHLGNFTATIHTTESILILDNGGTFGTQVSKHFLGNCIRSKDLYHCMEDSVYTRDVDDLCLVRLYKGNTKDIDRVCNVKLTRRKEIIQRLSSNSFRVLADSPQALITDCKRGVSNHPRKLTVKSSQTVSFNQTCRVTSNNYVFTTSVDLLDHTETLNMDLDIFEPLDPSFFHGFDEEELLETFNTTRKTPSGYVLLSEFRSNLESRKRGKLLETLQFSGLIAVGSVLLLTILCILMRWQRKSYCRRAQQEENTELQVPLQGVQRPTQQELVDRAPRQVFRWRPITGPP